MSPVVGMLWRSSRAMGYPVCGERGQEATRIAGRLASAANQTAPVLIASAARDVLRGLSLVIPGVVGCAARYFWREHVGGARRVRRGACPCIGEGLPPLCMYALTVVRLHALCARVRGRCFASMSFQQAHQYFSAVWADGFPRSRHHAVSDVR